MTEQTEKRDTVRVLIVDDEPLARDCIRLALSGANGVEIIAECADGASAVEAIGATGPDLVFLDVQMPDLDGFGVIERVGAERMPFVVFVTAFDAHALRAFEVHAIDYVLKPFDDRRILSTVERVRERMREHQRSELARRLADVVQSWSAGTDERLEERVAHTPSVGVPTIQDSRNSSGVAPSDWDEEDDGRAGETRGFIARFAVRGDGRVRFVMTADVDWIEADRNYVFLHVGDVKHRLRASLRHVTARLDPRTFVRIHRSAVVNIHCIREVQPWFGGDYVAILRNGTKLKVSRLRASKLLKPMT
ncbi:MAG: response regulator transcription factor [Gemmatimonadaceae bacterium]